MGNTSMGIDSKNVIIENDRFAVLRVDTHGNRFVVEQHLCLQEAKQIEAYYDSLPHHQGYYVVNQRHLQEELSRNL
jgi:hypothetical protein